LDSGPPPQRLCSWPLYSELSALASPPAAICEFEDSELESEQLLCECDERSQPALVVNDDSHNVCAAMLGQVQPTEFDLRFSAFGIPVRVHPGFWLISALMGRGALQNPDYGPTLLLIWIGCVFVSILVHEFGHALTADRFGWSPEVVLYYMGGYAAYMPTRGHTPRRSILISLAGPGAGFVLYGMVVLIEWVYLQYAVPNILTLWAFGQLKWINLGWGLVNLLPVLPLDGGRVSEELCGLWRRRDGYELSVKIGMVIGGAVSLYFFVNHESYGLWPGILFAFLCYNNYQMYESRHRGSW